MIKGELTEEKIACAYKVHNTSGAGFLENVYENSLVIELRKRGLKAGQNPAKIHDVQTVNYFKGINKGTGLLINFDTSVEVKCKYKTLKTTRNL